MFFSNILMFSAFGKYMLTILKKYLQLKIAALIYKKGKYLCFDEQWTTTEDTDAKWRSHMKRYLNEIDRLIQQVVMQKTTCMNRI